jgi:hypothetical protein
MAGGVVAAGQLRKYLNRTELEAARRRHDRNTRLFTGSATFGPSNLTEYKVAALNAQRQTR